MPSRPERYRPHPKRPSPAEQSRGTAADRGYDYRWQQFRLAYLGRHPLCVRCRSVGLTVEAEHVDHIDNLGPLGPLGYDEANLQALCATCHRKKTAAETKFGRGQS